MAGIGLYGVYYAKATVEDGVVTGYTGGLKTMGKAISASFEPTTPDDNPLYANNAVGDNDASGASGGTLTLTLDRLTQAAAADMFGLTVQDVEVTVGTSPGETVAIIGPTGSGKSTVINLIPRLADASEGSVLIDGRDVREYNVDDLRRNIGFVPQKNILFSGTIASNLRMGDENATDEQLRKAAEIAQAEEFISEKPEGINDPIAQGGTNVSGGQKQRLAIARALVKKAPIYIFDDSFSALDFKTDAALRSALAENMKDSTVIIVAQRVGTIMNADRIIVLDDGRIAGVGTHRELLETCEVYNQIAKSQLSEEDLKR